MKVESKKLGDCRVRLTIAATAEECREDYDAVVGEYVKNAPIPGFRRGKAPLDVVKGRFGPSMKGDVNSRLVSRFVREAIEREKLDVVNVVNAEDVIFAPETGVSFVATIDVRPEFKLPKYQKLPLKVGRVEVSDEGVEEQIRQLRRSHAKSQETDGPAAEGDYLEVSFEALGGDGAPLEGVPEESARYVKSDSFWLLAGEKPGYEAIPGSRKAMLGLRRGDSFTFEAQFPEDFPVEALRKAKAAYAGKVICVRAMSEPGDEELVGLMKVESMDKLRELVRQHMEKQGEAAERQRLEGEISQLLLKKASFEVPDSEVQRMLRGAINEVIEREYAEQENLEGYVRDHADEIREKGVARATEQLRLFYIADAIAAEQGIKVARGDVDGEIARTAHYLSMRDRKAPTSEKLRSQLEASGRLPAVESQIRYRKVIDWIIEDLRAAK